MSNKKHLILAILGFTSLLSSCSGGGEQQVSGIFAEAQFSTIACEPKSKLITLRNDDTSNPQRVQGVSFEMGTNENSNFKIDKVTIGSTEFEATANMVQDVIIPAGGVMTVQATYNPRKITSPGTPDVSYMDIFLNGPRLGIMQVRMVGQADTAAEGCGAGETVSFTVNNIVITVKATGLVPGGEFQQTIPGSEITKPFKIVVNNGQATLVKADFPEFKITNDNIPTSDHSLPVILLEDTDGTFDGAALEFDPITLSASGINVPGTMGTGSLTKTGTPSSVTISESGTPLGSDGNMKVVFVGNIPSGSAAALDGGVVSAVFDLTKQ